MDEQSLARIQRELLALIRKAQGVGVMKMEQDALELWDAVYPELSADHPGLAGCIINRGEAQAIRLSIIYALLDGKAHIGAEHLRAGLAFWDYCRESALYIFGDRAANPVAQKILVLLSDGRKMLTELHRATGNNIPGEKMQDALRELIKEKRIKSEFVTTTRRPQTFFSLCEFNEFNEFIPREQGGEPTSSLNSLNSYAGEKKSASSFDSEPEAEPEMWDGEDEVFI